MIDLHRRCREQSCQDFKTLVNKNLVLLSYQVQIAILNADLKQANDEIARLRGERDD